MKKLSILGLSLIAAALTTSAAMAKIKSPPKERKNETIVKPARFSQPIYWTSVRIIGPAPFPVPGVTLRNENTGETIVTNASGKGILNVSLGDRVTALAPNGYKGWEDITAGLLAAGRANIYVYYRP